MTEKRFFVPEEYGLSHSKVQLNGDPLTNDEIVRLLNVNDGAFTENFTLKKENNELKEFKEKVSELIDEQLEFVQDCHHKAPNIFVFSRDESYYRGAYDILQLLKKELSE